MSSQGGASAELQARVAWSVVLPFAFAYFLSYVYRSINAVIAPDLIAEFSLSAADLGLLTSAYFLAFASFQVPLGILLDRFGPRRVNASLFLVAAAGAMVFSLSKSFSTLLAGRALIGLGVSAGLMSSIKVFTIWFPMERLPALTGRMLFVGGLGAMAATMPVEAALDITDWRGVFRFVAVLTGVAAVAIFFVVPERGIVHRHETWGEQLRGVGRVFRAGIFWRMAAASALFQAINMAVQGLWAGPWLVDVAGLDRSAVAGHLLALAAATMTGFLGWGVAAFRLTRYGVTPLALFKTGTALFIVVQVLLALGVTTGSAVLWIAFGLFGAIVGLWPGETGHYHPDGYRAAFSLLLGLEIAAFAWLTIGTRPLKTAAGLS